jgi:hypothetical protein
MQLPGLTLSMAIFAQMMCNAGKYRCGVPENQDINSIVANKQSIFNILHHKKETKINSEDQKCN